MLRRFFWFLFEVGPFLTHPLCYLCLQIMHSVDTHHRFIELRAKGWSLDRIAAELGVAKRTLLAWQRQHASEIGELRHLELEALHERLLGSHEQVLGRLAAQLHRVEAVLAQRKFESLSTEFLFCMAGALRSQIHRQRGDLALVLSPPALPATPAALPLPATPAGA